MNSKFNRRFFINKGCKASSAMALALAKKSMIVNFITSTIDNANAETLAGTVDTMYLNINFGGGPPRYMFDHWLKTDSSSSVNPIWSPYISNSFVYGSDNVVTTGEYRTFDYKGYAVPHIFSTFDSSDMDEFLNEFLIIQGYGSGIDGHAVNTHLQQHPLSSAPSILGYMADASPTAFKSIMYPSTSVRYVSATKAGINKLNGAEPLSQLLSPLISTLDSRELINNHKSAISTIRDAIFSLDRNSDAVSLAQNNLKGGLNLLESGLSDFETVWPDLLAKYETAVLGAIRDTSVAGLNANHDNSGAISFPCDLTDARFDSGTSEGFIAEGSDVLQLCNNMESASLIQGLAMTEYCFKHGLASSIRISGGGRDNLLLRPGTGNTSSFSMGNDHHGGGGWISSVAGNFIYRGLIAGILELKTNLKSYDVWKDTVIQISSEFDRTISSKGTGSGHGTEQMVTSVISGRIKEGPYVVGNVLNALSDGYVSQGYAAPIDGYSSTRPTPITMASTLTEVLGVGTNPWSSFASPLINRNTDGTLTLPYGKGKVI